MSDAYVPDPMSCHPHYAEQADGIRALLHLSEIRVPRANVVASWAAPDDARPIEPAVSRVDTLTVKRLAGPAPFVGDARFQVAWYTWRAAVDHVGRHVAGDSTLEWGHR